MMNPSDKIPSQNKNMSYNKSAKTVKLEQNFAKRQTDLQ